MWRLTLAQRLLDSSCQQPHDMVFEIKKTRHYAEVLDFELCSGDFLRNGLVDAEKVFDEMSIRGVWLDSSSYKSMVVGNCFEMVGFWRQIGGRVS